MKIGMIAAMVIGMVVLNGCGFSPQACENTVRLAYPGATVIGDKFIFVVIDSGKVTTVKTMNLFDTNITDSTTYFVPSKCKN